MGPSTSHRKRRLRSSSNVGQPQVRIAQLVRRGAAEIVDERGGEPAIVIEAGDVRITIGRDADAGMVVLALALLGGRR